MVRATFRGVLLSLSMLAVPVVAQQAAAAPADATGPSPETVVRDLGQRLDDLQGLLDAVRDARGEPLRQTAMERHWKSMQDYMTDSLRLAVRTPGTSSLADCQVVGSSWAGLSFPGQLRSDEYLKSMQAQLGRMRMGLIEIHDARDPEALDAALQAHWRDNYQFLQTARGLAWMFSGWTPTQPGDQALPDPQSEGARLTQDYCSVCHAVPQTRLHSAEEWSSVMSTMSRHMALSDGGIPACVKMPSAAELNTISAYLAKYAR